MNYDKPTLEKVLSENVCQVTFTKVDGSKRIMKCTLIESALPKKIQTDEENKRTRVVSDSVVPVFDLEKQAWRSFKIESVINVEIIAE